MYGVWYIISRLAACLISLSSRIRFFNKNDIPKQNYKYFIYTQSSAKLFPIIFKLFVGPK